MTILVRSLLALAAIFAVPQMSPATPVKEVRRVVIFYELGLSSPAVAVMDQQIRTALENSQFQIELYREYLETTLFPDPATQNEFREWYIHKYRNRKTDLVIALGPSPVNFVLDAHGNAFTNTPIVFGGAPEDMADHPSLDHHFTGVWERFEPAKTLELALKLLPETKHVVLVGGTSPFDRRLENIFRQGVHNYETKVDFTYLTDLDMPTLLERLKHLPQHSVILYTHLGQDAAGTRFIGASQSAPMIASAANAPIFSPSDVDLGHGEMGGYLQSFAAEGKIVAGMALSILDGKSPQDIPIVTGANAYMFDSRALKRWGIKESALPPGSTVLNRQPTVWEAYKAYIIGGISLILAEALLIFALLWQRTKRRAAETELAITFDRLRMAVEAGSSVGWDWDLKTGRDQWFGDLETVFGIPSHSFSGHVDDFRRKIHPEDRELARRAVADARNNRTPYAAEFRVIRTDGTVRWITARGNFYYTSNGDAERMLGMAVDITDRKLAEEALRGSEQRLRLAVQAGRMYAYEWDAATDTIVRSAEFADVLGTDQGVHTSRRELIVQVHPDDREQLTAEFTRVTPESPYSQFQYRLLRPDGSLLWLERRARALYDDEGKLQRILGVVADITDRKQAEHKLRESEERFRLVANTAPVMIWMAGTDKLCSYFNQPWLEFTGRSLEAELGNGWAEMVHPEDFQACLHTYNESFNRHERFEMQYRLRRHDGEYRWLVDIGVPRFESDGSFAGYIGSCIDITDRKRAEEAMADIGRRLIEAHEEERTWIGRELHDDINQRLALAVIELERWGHSKSEVDLHEHIGHVKQRLSDLGKDVQALSHRLHSSKLDYLGLTVAANGFCREFSEQQKVEIDFTHKGMPSRVSKEISLCLFRILQEALQNAVKYSGVRRFSVNFEGTPTEIQLTISDHGIGFDQHNALYGRGLGLISMRERAHLVKGELSVTSRPAGGTTVLARVPVEAEDRRTSLAG